MTPRRPDALTAAILAAADIAEAGARVMLVPERDVPDVVQETLLAVWRRAQRGDFSPEDRARLRVYIFVTAKNIGAARWREIARASLPGELPEMVVDPLPRLEARSTLRALPMPAYLRAIFECLAVGASLHAVADALDLPVGTIATRLRKLRAARQR